MAEQRLIRRKMVVESIVAEADLYDSCRDGFLIILYKTRSPFYYNVKLHQLPILNQIERVEFLSYFCIQVEF